jgi:hypothetical protein
LANVYHPSRLRVVQPCLTVSGTAAEVRHEDDGDFHINVDLDPRFAGLINDRNVSGEHGALVVEIVPADEPGCTVGQPPRPPSGTYDYGLCTGANETAPSIGAHVSVTGPYVLDTAHGWMEIHPAWSITSADSTANAPAVTTTAPSAAPSTSAGTDRPAGATARCNDGTYSFAAHHQGACSTHGGVAVFYQ